MNSLFYGDNLAVLRKDIRDESVDLIYLDPPFNSKATYNVLFKAPSGERSQAQIEAFGDTWHWDQSAELAFDEVLKSSHAEAAIMLNAMRRALGENDMMAYLAMMTVRLLEMHRVLKETGSLYLHCDPTASHYLKIILDALFGRDNMRNEITWKRQSAHSDAKSKFPDVSDTILFYAKSPKTVFYPTYRTHDPDYLKKFYRFDDDDGRGPYQLADAASPNPRPNMMYEWMGYSHPEKGWRYERDTMQRLHDEGRLFYPTDEEGKPDYSKRIRLKRYFNEQEGSIITNVWTDIHPLHSSNAERLGYPTQKPVALLERILRTSSSEGDVVLDPFCGCGTTVHAAQKLDRQWIGIDITHLAISLIERRLKNAFPGIEYDVHGVPKDYAGARDLAARDKYEFQKWITTVVGAQPYKSGKKGMDRGIDGYLHFRDADNKPQFGIVSVKGGEKITSGMIRDLKGTMERENAALGVFLTLNEPTREMAKEAASTGFYETGGQKIPRLQILTASEILDGVRPQVPFGHIEGFKDAVREKTESKQRRLL